MENPYTRKVPLKHRHAARLAQWVSVIFIVIVLIATDNGIIALNINGITKSNLIVAKVICGFLGVVSSLSHRG